MCGLFTFFLGIFPLLQRVELLPFDITRSRYLVMAVDTTAQSTSQGKKTANAAAKASTGKRSGRLSSKSLVAFLRAIKFRKSNTDETQVDRYFAKPRPRARQRRPLTEENYWVRSAN
jgi:hypothetical protein